MRRTQRAGAGGCGHVRGMDGGCHAGNLWVGYHAGGGKGEGTGPGKRRESLWLEKGRALEDVRESGGKKKWDER